LAAEPEIFVALRERRFVENDGIGASRRRPPVPLAIFRAGIEGIPIDERRPFAARWHRRPSPAFISANSVSISPRCGFIAASK
jgi:hypothetical protein